MKTKKNKQTNNNLQQTEIFTTTKKEHYKVKKTTNKQTNKRKQKNKQENVIYAPFGSQKKTLIDIMPDKNNILGDTRVALCLV